MKQCSNCEQWIPDEYGYCPACGEHQPNMSQNIDAEKEKGSGTGCFYTIIICIIILLLSGVGLYLYNNGFFSKTNSTMEDSLISVVDSNLIEVGLPDTLTLDGAIYGKNIVTIDVAISTSGNIEGRFYDISKKMDYPIVGQGDSKTGNIILKIKDKDLTLDLIPIGNGSYDAKWSTSTSEGTSYFYAASGQHLSIKEEEIPEFNPDSIFESEDVVEAAPVKSSMKLEGKLDGEIAIQMNLYDLEGGKGEYYYVSQGSDKKIKLKCKKESANQWRLIEYGEDGDIQGTFVGKLEDGIFMGRYVDKDGEEYAVTLFEQ